MMDENAEAFNSLINVIITQVTMSTPDPSKRLCLFKDDSSTHWAGVITQVDPAEMTIGTKHPQ